MQQQQQHITYKQPIVLYVHPLSHSVGTQVAASDPRLAPNLLVLDTNILLAELANIHTLVDDLRKHPDVDATIIIPREVYHELDILKNKPGDTYRIRAAVRYLEELRSMQLKGRWYPYLRVQVGLSH